MRLSNVLTLGLSVLGGVDALPGRAKFLSSRQISQPRDEYDFVIIGGGTSGLTLAHRVAAALPKSEFPTIHACFAKDNLPLTDSLTLQKRRFS